MRHGRRAEQLRHLRYLRAGGVHRDHRFAGSVDEDDAADDSAELCADDGAAYNAAIIAKYDEANYYPPCNNR